MPQTFQLEYNSIGGSNNGDGGIADKMRVYRRCLDKCVRLYAAA